MTEMNVEAVVKQFLNKPRNDWKMLTDELSSSELQEVERTASGTSVFLAEVAEYCGQQGAYGCGSRDHEGAMKAVMRKRAAVRKAIGYTYP